MFIEALFMAAETWRRPKRLRTDERIQMWYVHTRNYYVAVKKDGITPGAVAQMQLEIITPSEAGQKKRQIRAQSNLSSKQK